MNQMNPVQLMAPDDARPSGKHRRQRKTPVQRQRRGLRDLSGLQLHPMPEALAPAHAATYPEMVQELTRHYKISIRKWRSHMAGVAYELTYGDGRIKRLISAPRPRSPVSAAIFLHEVGHHAIGFKRYSPRCLEEHYVWQWTFREMESRRIPVTPRVMQHFRRSMFHYVKAAQKRGEHVPAELAHFSHWPG